MISNPWSLHVHTDFYINMLTNKPKKKKNNLIIPINGKYNLTKINRKIFNWFTEIFIIDIVTKI